MWNHSQVKIMVHFQIIEFESPSMLSIDPDSHFSKLLQAADLQKAQNAADKAQSVKKTEQDLKVPDDPPMTNNDGISKQDFEAPDDASPANAIVPEVTFAPPEDDLEDTQF